MTEEELSKKVGHICFNAPYLGMHKAITDLVNQESNERVRQTINHFVDIHNYSTIVPLEIRLVCKIEELRKELL